MNTLRESYKKMTAKELKDFIFQNYYKRNWIYYRKQQLFNEILNEKRSVTKLIKQIPDASNAKEYYRPFLKSKNKIS